MQNVKFEVGQKIYYKGFEISDILLNVWNESGLFQSSLACDSRKIPTISEPTSKIKFSESTRIVDIC